eukprot:SAG11_NODE_4087_length_2071_cov_2.766227_1_plen_109_part_00
MVGAFGASFDPFFALPSQELMSTECQSLIHGMLRPDVAERFTVAQVLQHPWAQAGVGQMPPPPALASNGTGFMPMAGVDWGAAPPYQGSNESQDEAMFESSDEDSPFL